MQGAWRRFAFCLTVAGVPWNGIVYCTCLGQVFVLVHMLLQVRVHVHVHVHVQVYTEWDFGF